MHDMTQGPIRGHILRMGSFILVGMVVQTLYSLVDIYWVSHLGKTSIAAVAVASNLMFVVIAVSQMLGVGTVALVSQAAGRKAQDEVQFLFNQSNGLSLAAAVLSLLSGIAFGDNYANALASDAETAAQIRDFLHWFGPAMSLQFTMVGLSSSLRSVGNMRPGMLAQTGSVLLNMLLAPFLIFGWLGLPRMGIAGAGCATLISTLIASAALVAYITRGHAALRFGRDILRPDFAVWRRMLGIGLPAGAEFLIMAASMGFIYSVLKPFGADAQAGFGIGTRLMQAGFIPAVALSFGMAAVVGQNYGAGLHDRVREIFREGAKLAVLSMLLFTALCHGLADSLVSEFSDDPAVVRIGADYLRIISFSYVASALVMAAGGIFQGVGNAWPSLLASVTRFGCYVAVALWLMSLDGFAMTQIWWAAVLSVVLQALLALLFLRREFARRLPLAA